MNEKDMNKDELCILDPAALCWCDLLPLGLTSFAPGVTELDVDSVDFLGLSTEYVSQHYHTLKGPSS